MHFTRLSVENSIGTISMERPEKRNALSPEMVADLSTVFVAAAADSDIKVIILRGKGAAFCAGADLEYLKQIRDIGPLENLADSTALASMLQGIVDCPKPVIAMVHGPAIAGGCGLATVCDFIVAGRNNALFGYSEAKIGFIPAIVMVYLLRKVGDTHTRRLVLSAENINAEEAARIGLVTYVTDDDKLEGETIQLARQIALNSSSSMALIKEMLSSLYGLSGESSMRYAALMNAFARQTADAKAGIDDFVAQKQK
ncbi:MAG: enoyl-CoA hydratase/isomerase family protein [Ignavibacteria bacterium]|nr:enoyl-CoA hydratase/isomerase family protein [Ignavibacteria bacterium]